jgi:hypothetical protein
VGLPGSQRIIRHVWRIGFSLIWAALAFADKVIKLQDSTIEEMPFVAIVPTIAILLTVVFWVVKILFSSNKEFAKYT